MDRNVSQHERTGPYLDWACEPPAAPSGELEYRLIDSEFVARNLLLDDLRAPLEIVRELTGKCAGIASTQHIVLTTGTMDGLRIVTSAFLARMRCSSSPEVLVSDAEFRPLYGFLSRHLNARLTIAGIRGARDPDAIVDAVLTGLRPTTGMVILSHVTYDGTLVPVARVAEAVKRRRPDIKIVVDGAQAFGQVAVQLEGTRIDAYAADYHKWVLGPKGGGFLYVGDDSHLADVALGSFDVLALSPDLAESTGYVASGAGHVQTSLSCFNFAALAAARPMLTSLLDGTVTRVLETGNRTLSGLFRERLAERSHLAAECLIPATVLMSAGIVSLRSRDASLWAALQDQGIRCTYLPELRIRDHNNGWVCHPAVTRLSFDSRPGGNTVEDVDSTADAVAGYFARTSLERSQQD